MSNDEPRLPLCNLYEGVKGFFCDACKPRLEMLAESLAVYHAALIEAIPPDQAEVAVGRMAVAAETRGLIQQFAGMAVAIRQTVDRRRAFVEKQVAEANDDDQREWWGLQLQDLDYCDQTGQAIEAQLAGMGFPLEYGDDGLDAALP